MKRFSSLLLSILLLLSLCACGAKPTKDDFTTGIYHIASAVSESGELSVHELWPAGFTIELKANGRCVFSIDGEKYNGSWTLSQSSFHAEGGGAVLEGTLSNGVLSICNLVSSGTDAVFICDEIVKRVEEKIAVMAQDFSYYGVWTCSDLVCGRIVCDISAASPLRQFYLELCEDGNAVAVFGDTAWRCSWQKGDQGIELRQGSEGIHLSLTAESALLLELDSSDYILSRCPERPDFFSSFRMLYENTGYNEFPYISLSAEESCAMSSFMLGGRYLADGNTLYGTVLSSAGNPHLCRVEISSGNVLASGIPSVLDSYAKAGYICAEGDRLYYIRNDVLTGEVALVSITKSREDMTTIYSGKCSYLQIVDHMLYFTDSRDCLVCANPDGSELTELLPSKQIYCVYFIDSHRFIYRSGSDDGHLHLYDILSGQDITLTYQSSLNPIISGTELYYAVSLAGESFYHLCRIDLNSCSVRHEDGSARCYPSWIYEESGNSISSRFGCDGNSFISYDGNRVPKALWMNLTDTAWKSYSRVPQFISNSFSVFYNYSSGGLISDIEITSADFSDSIYLPLVQQR